MSRKPIHLGYILYNAGTNPSGWTETPRGSANDIGYFTRLAQMAEAAKLDMVFRADAQYARTNNVEAWSRNPAHMNTFEPLTFFAALSQATTSIGLAGTISTTFTDPYNVARQLASLDHMSGGRAAWNVVTSFSAMAARNFGQANIPTHAERYSRAREYVDVIRALWDTYEDDAFVEDAERGYYFDPAKFHPVHFEGRWIKLDGALNIARPPQGYPVTIQAGASPPGRQLAAETADVVFASNVPKPDAQAFYMDMKARTSAAGRDPNMMKVLPALTIVVGDTEEAARAEYEALDAKVPNAVRLQQLSENLSVSLLDLPLDRPVPLEMLPAEPRGMTNAFNTAADMVRSGIMLRDMLRYYRVPSGGTVLHGTGQSIADFIESWVDDAACDGFTIITPSGGKGFERFCAEVVPELQRRGSFRKDYTGRTLRDHLGLHRPPSRWKA
jgi:FMN-dependent oxidoreductase (nitrilotriacetate monooxygenase family)